MAAPSVMGPPDPDGRPRPRRCRRLSGLTDARRSGPPDGPAARERPLGRGVRPDEVAGVVAWLASEAAASVTGEAVTIAGGGFLPA